MNVAEGKPLADRQVEVPAFGDVMGPLLARPPRNTRALVFEDPGPPAGQDRVQVPTRPEEGR